MYTFINAHELQVLCPTCGKLMELWSGQDKYVCCTHWFNAEKIRKKSKRTETLVLYRASTEEL